jgi:acyl-coenzyme A synthetase/AMP-(fatty) acid ligase
VGQDRCPLVDTWWQTETGGILISQKAGALLDGSAIEKPSYAGIAMDGVIPVLVNADGIEVLEDPAEGNMCIKDSWPGMARTIFNDHERYLLTYFKPYAGYYFTGDGAMRDGEGRYRITGRVDDVINISGHRIGTAEVESAVCESELVTEAAVVGRSHPIKGQGLYVFAVCGQDVGPYSSQKGYSRVCFGTNRRACSARLDSTCAGVAEDTIGEDYAEDIAKNCRRGNRGFWRCFYLTRACNYRNLNCGAP